MGFSKMLPDLIIVGKNLQRWREEHELKMKLGKYFVSYPYSKKDSSLLKKNLCKSMAKVAIKVHPKF